MLLTNNNEKNITEGQLEIIKPQSAKMFRAKRGECIKIIDLEGQQVADFWAYNNDNENDFFSAGVTIDCNRKLLVSTGDTLYTNRYHPFFKIIEDSVGTHDLIHPCCRQEMYDHLYNNDGTPHPSCLQNINDHLQQIGRATLNEIHPFNVFMNTHFQADGKITIHKPVSQPGDSIVLETLVDNATILVAACSVDSGNCNGGQCGPIGVVID